jgi:glucan 1,3-beta-glucosidase
MSQSSSSSATVYFLAFFAAYLISSFEMCPFLWSSLFVVTTQLLPVLSFTINRSFNTSVDSQATLLERQDPSYWLADISHQGVAAFNPDSTYQVFPNVKDYGATGRSPALIPQRIFFKLINPGDGVTDDIAAINAAVSAGARCVPGSCAVSTITPAVVYFPTGTYILSSSIIDYYYTQLIGNLNSQPTLKGMINFQGLGLIDGDLYSSTIGNQDYGSTDMFYVRIRFLFLLAFSFMFLRN